MLDNRLKDSGPHRGLWSMTASPLVLELMAALQPDYICIDLQHGTEWSQVNCNTLTAVAYYGVPTLLRVPGNDEAQISWALDLGADGVMIPFVNSAREAEAAVAACRYPPQGRRSYGLHMPRIPTGLDRAACVVQIETDEAIANVDSIAEVDGVDVLYIGPSDLGMSLGGEAGRDVISIYNGSHPLSTQMSEALGAVVTAARAAEKHAGLHCGSGQAAAVAEQNGFTFNTIATDVTALQRDMANQLAAVRAGAAR